MAVRSSASAEDLPEASFAGAAETFLNVRGEEGLLRAVHQCFASLFTDRAISYRARQGYSQLKVALSVGVMPMVRSDLAASGVVFTLDTESGFRDVVTITGSYGLGELVVQGVVTPDEWLVFKPTLHEGYESIVGRQLGSKEIRMVYAAGTRSTRSEATSEQDRARYCLDGLGSSATGAVGLHYRRPLFRNRRAPAANGYRMGEGRVERGAIHRAGSPGNGAFGEKHSGHGGGLPPEGKAWRSRDRGTSGGRKNWRGTRSRCPGCGQIAGSAARRSARCAEHGSRLGAGNAARSRDCYRPRRTNGTCRHRFPRVRHTLHRGNQATPRRYWRRGER